MKRLLAFFKRANEHAMKLYVHIRLSRCWSYKALKWGHNMELYYSKKK